MPCMHAPASTPCQTSLTALPTAVTEAYVYNASTSATFQWYPMRMEYAAAEATCNSQGGHLAIYTSLAEQVEVEQYYVKQGYMFPTYTLSYWIGLRSNRTGWPAFDWMNMAFAPPKRFRDRCVARAAVAGAGAAHGMVWHGMAWVLHKLDAEQHAAWR
jgi:hypothetical protein